MTRKKEFYSNYKVFKILFLVLISGLSVTSSHSQQYLQYQEFIIPGPEELIYETFYYLINNRTMSADIQSIISVTVDADQTVIHYDHWENGYGGSDEILTLNKGETHVFESMVRARPRDPEQVLYDGGDRIYVLGGSAFVSRTNWPIYPGPLLAMAFQVYPTQALENYFVIPVGDTLGQSNDNLPFADFKAVAFLIQSIEDNNNLTVEDAEGNILWQGSINKGQCIRDPIIYEIQNGYRIYGDYAFQVHILTGDNELEIGYEVNGVAGIPMKYWDSNYLIPLTSFQKSSAKNNNRTDLYLFNPNDYPITIQFEDSTTGHFEIDPLDLVSYFDKTGHYLPLNSGLSLNGSDTFWGFGYTGTGFDQYDWAFELVGDNLLGESYVVGWAPGDHNKQHNYSAVFATTFDDNVTVYIDFEQDGVVDDQRIISFPKVTRIVDPNDFDMTGARIWADKKLACAYGAIAGESTPESEPSIDSGYSIIFATEDWADQIMALTKKTEFDTIALTRANTFAVSLKSYDQVISEIVMTDSLPAGWDYETESARIYLQSTNQTIDQEPLVTGTIQDGLVLEWTVNTDMTVYDSLSIEYQATPQESETIGENENDVRVYCQIGEDNMTDNAGTTIIVVEGGEINGQSWYDANYNGLRDNGEPPLQTTVVLNDENLNAIDSVQTDINGSYSITNVNAGTYQLLFRPIESYHYTRTDQGTDDQVDSDAQRNSGLTHVFAVGVNEILEFIDCGYTDWHEADLEITKTTLTNSALLNSFFNYTLSVHNHGPDSALNIIVDDSLSTLLAFEEGNPQPHRMENGHLIWEIDHLQAGASIQFEYQVRVDDTGEIDTKACVSADSQDPNEDNNCQTCLVNTYYPIELSSFSAEYIDHAVELKWVSQSETQNYGYHIYRSLEKEGEYIQITTEMIPGAGNSEEKNEYFYSDKTIQAGNHYYYKLADINYEGIMTFHKSISIDVPLPSDYSLEPNFPNPFNPETQLTIRVPKDGNARVEIYNIQGRRIRTLLNKNISAGNHVLTWNGCNDSGIQMPSGIYFAIFEMNGIVQKQKMTLLR